MSNVSCPGRKHTRIQNIVNTSHYVIIGVIVQVPRFDVMKYINHADEHKYFDIAQAQHLDFSTSSWTILSNLYGHIKKNFFTGRNKKFKF